jgi:hypothetical protein
MPFKAGALGSSKESTERREADAARASANPILARPSLHRASATAGTTFDAEGTLAPIIDAIVGIIGQVWRHGLLPDMRPPLDPVSASLQTGAVALATRFARCLSDGSVAGDYDRTCGEKADQKSSKHGLLLLGWMHRGLMNDCRPPHAQSGSALAFFRRPVEPGKPSGGAASALADNQPIGRWSPGSA